MQPEATVEDDMADEGRFDHYELIRREDGAFEKLCRVDPKASGSCRRDSSRIERNGSASWLESRRTEKEGPLTINIQIATVVRFKDERHFLFS